MNNCVVALALGLWLLGGCSARVVTVPPGLLIRVEGQPVSISCDVKEYTGPTEQDFEWNMLKDTSGPKIKIISTFDSRYTDPSLSKRVASGDISVVRLQDNEVELKIAQVKLQDAGFYECQTPSTDYVISGNYAAKVQLTVIPNTLKVSSKTLPPVIPEGSDLTLSCNIARELVHPTYLSVTWSVKKGTASEEILTFGPQGDVVTGSSFAQRYADGGIRLAPGRNGLFELVISRMTTSDEGNYECTGTEWTYESGGRWTKLVEDTKEMGTVAVTPTEPVKSYDSVPCYVVSSFLGLYSLIITSMLIKEKISAWHLGKHGEQDRARWLEWVDPGLYAFTRAASHGASFTERASRWRFSLSRNTQRAAVHSLLQQEGGGQRLPSDGGVLGG